MTILPMNSPSLPKIENTRSLIASFRSSSSMITIKGKALINFSSNDYLGLSTHPSLIANANRYLHAYGTSNSSSRLVSGNNAPYTQIEESLSSFMEREETLVFSSGYQANLSILPSLTDRHSLILLDRLSHRSLIEGAKSSLGKMIRFDHKDYQGLEEILKKNTLSNSSSISSIWIVSDTLFSMDGDFADLSQLKYLCQKYKAHLYLDEAHAIGIFGKSGKGLSHGIKADIILGTFGKAFGSFGAFASCSKAIKDHLINTCPGLIYTTALPPSILGSIQAAIDLMPSLDQERRYLLQQADTLRSHLKKRGWNSGGSASHIIPLILKEEEKATQLAEALMQKGIYLYPMRPPSVPHHSSRLRISLSSSHSQEQIDYLMSALNDLEEFIL